MRKPVHSAMDIGRDPVKSESCEMSKHQQRPLDAKKVALVTGASSGIGANIAVDLAATDDYIVILVGRSLDKLAQVELKCQQTVLKSNPDSRDVCAYKFVCDLDNFEQLDGLIGFIKTKFNRLDLLVNNACYRGGIKNISDKDSFHDLEKAMVLNVHVPMYLINKCLLPLNSDCSREPVLINISSIASQVAVPLNCYSISKSCLSELTRQIALRDECGIKAITISPGPILTEERPHHQSMSEYTLVNRVGTTQEVSDLVLFAAENACLFNGQELFIDGGYLAKTKQKRPAVIQQ